MDLSRVVVEVPLRGSVPIVDVGFAVFVSVRDGANALSGQTLTVDLATGDWRLEDGANQRVQTVITPPAR